ncbi:MAG: amino acid transport protein [Vicinamibacterales bacterium]
MNFDATWLMLSLIPSGLGFVLFAYGKKQQRWPHFTAGLLYMVYPYFATTVMSLVAIGGVIALGLWFAVRLDW